jgi:hypothetical protein
MMALLETEVLSRSHTYLVDRNHRVVDFNQ